MNNFSENFFTIMLTMECLLQSNTDMIVKRRYILISSPEWISAP